MKRKYILVLIVLMIATIIGPYANSFAKDEDCKYFRIWGQHDYKVVDGKATRTINHKKTTDKYHYFDVTFTEVCNSCGKIHTTKTTERAQHSGYKYMEPKDEWIITSTTHTLKTINFISCNACFHHYETYTYSRKNQKHDYWRKGTRKLGNNKYVDVLYCDCGAYKKISSVYH